MFKRPQDTSRTHLGVYQSFQADFFNTVKPRYNAPAYTEFPPIEHTNFVPKKHFHSYFYIGNSENLRLEHNFDQSLEIRYIGVQLYCKMGENQAFNVKVPTRLRTIISQLFLNRF